MTQITRKSPAPLRPILLLALFLGASLALTGCGGDDTATTPAPAPPPPAPAPEPEPPAPEAPATPTGLMVSATTTDSITWTWNAVEGATGYAVQTSMDEMFDDSDTTTLTTETTHTQSGLEPETSVYARVAAAAGTMENPVQSAWTTHVTGMSAMPPPPPPPPAPDPVSVTFMAPAGKMPLMPDTSTDKATAMATVNPDMKVTSNTTAVLEPVGFADGAAPVSLSAGDNMPFKFVDWKALQSKVVEDGVSFRITRTTLGANQEVMQTGDVVFWTCGPFECVEGMDAPAYSIQNSAACSVWDPELTLEVGVIDPAAVAATPTPTPTATATGTPTATRAPDRYARLDGQQTTRRSAGFDLGWRYTARTDFSVKHNFTSFSSPGGTVKADTDQALPVGRPRFSGEPATPLRRDITDSLNGTGLGRVVIGTTTGANGTGCYPNTPTPLYLNTGSRTLQEPENCFRLSTVARYPQNYTVELTPKNAGVSWGSITWEAFQNLNCPAETFDLMDQLDVCELLEEEVDTLVLVASAGVDFWVDGSASPGPQLEGFDIKVRTNQTRWTQLNYYDDTTSDRNDTEDLYSTFSASNQDSQDQKGAVNGAPKSSPANTRNRWIKLHDADGRPLYGDLGKVDAKNVPSNRTAGANYGGDDKAENYSGSARNCTADDWVGTPPADMNRPRSATNRWDGSLCDARVEIPSSVTFTDGMGFGCSVRRSYTLTCTWDASGALPRSDDLASTITRGLALTAGDTSNTVKFLACVIREN